MSDTLPTICPQRTRPAFDYSPEVANEITLNAIICPLFEKGLFQQSYIRHYSLNRNENLRCAWAEYKRKFETRVFAPFQFPDARDLHFYNGTIRFLPSETDYKRATFRYTLKPGPGVDYAGQMPIPQELLMKRITSQKEEKGKKKTVKGKKAQNKKHQEGEIEQAGNVQDLRQKKKIIKKTE